MIYLSLPMSRIWANMLRVKISHFFLSIRYTSCVLHLTCRSPSFSSMAPAVVTSSRRADNKLTHHFQARVPLSGDTIKQTQRKVTQKQNNVSEKVFVYFFIFLLFLSPIPSQRFIFYTIKHKGWSQIGRHKKGNNNISFIPLQKSLSSIDGVTKLCISPTVF
jgi:hypothetical protein